MEKTMDDLKAAFAGESQANRRYTAFARKADEEGYKQVARLFRAIAAGETVHALSHFKVMDGIQSTRENLKTAIAGEHYEVVTMYPDFMKDAQAENNKAANVSFDRAWNTEKVHEQLYTEALAALDGAQGEVFDYYICPVCGFIHARNAPERCPNCQTIGTRFEKMQ
jgi:rubrerythrin